MDAKLKAALEAIYTEAEAKHGPVFRNAVDTLAATSAVMRHAESHCDDLVEDIQTVCCSAVRRILEAGGISHLAGEAVEYANRILRTANAHEGQGAPPGTILH